MSYSPRLASFRQSVGEYAQRWHDLSRPAKLYLLHAALLTASLAVSALFFNLAMLSYGYLPAFPIQLNGLSVRVAAVLSIPLWWLVARLGLRWGMLTSAVLQAISLFAYAIQPATVFLLIAVGLSGAAAVLFQVSSPPFMMRHATAEERDYLFSANWAINLGVAGLGSLAAGGLPGFFANLLDVAPESALAYQATFAVAGFGLLLAIVPLLLIREREAAPRSPLSRSNEQHPVHDAHSPTEPVPQPWWERLIARVPAPYRPLVRQPWPLVAMLIPPFLISVGAALLIPLLNLFFKLEFGVSDSTLGVIFAALNVVTGLATLTSPLLSTRIGKMQTVVITQVLSIPFLLMLGFVPVLGVAIGAAIARQALFNMGSPLYDAFAMERTDERLRPIVIGLINGAYTGGYLLVPEISGSVLTNYGFAPLFVATTVCYSLAALTNYLLFVRGQRVARTAQQSG